MLPVFVFFLDILPLRLDYPMIRSSYNLFFSIHRFLVSHVPLAKNAFPKIALREYLLSLWFMWFQLEDQAFSLKPSEEDSVFQIICVSGCQSQWWVARMIHFTHANCCDHPKLDTDNWCNKKIPKPRSYFPSVKTHRVIWLLDIFLECISNPNQLSQCSLICNVSWYSMTMCPDIVPFFCCDGC